MSDNNGRKHQTTVLEKELITDSDTLEAVSTETSAKDVVPQQEKDKEIAPKKKKPIALIMAALGVGAIAAGGFGYRYWQYTSTHQETDNATVAGNIHQVSSRITGTVAKVLVNDNQLVQPGQILVELDPRDYQSKVQQATAALENARGQAQAAQANIALASETTVPELVERREDLANAIAINSTMINGARLIGPAIGGLLIARVGVAYCFLIDGLSYIAVIAGLLAMKIKPWKTPVITGNPLQQVREGFVYAFSFPPIRSLLLLSALVSLIGL